MRAPGSWCSPLLLDSYSHYAKLHNHSWAFAYRAPSIKALSPMFLRLVCSMSVYQGNISYGCCPIKTLKFNWVSLHERMLLIKLIISAACISASRPLTGNILISFGKCVICWKLKSYRLFSSIGWSSSNTSQSLFCLNCLTTRPWPKCECHMYS